MSLDEKQDFCRRLTLAAKAVGIGLGRIHLATGYRYVWNDNGAIIECASAADEKEALFKACEALQAHLHIPWHKPQDRPDTDIHGYV